MRNPLRRALPGLLILVGACAALTGWKLTASLPRTDGEIALPGLGSPAQVDEDGFGVPQIRAATRVDAYRVLGFLHARDRLFQMDLARRKSTGRLAELFGQRALELDRQQRAYQAGRYAEAILQGLPADQREILDTYAEGVNRYMGSLREWPFETLVLGYHPETWRPKDSLLVAFGMFQTLTSQEQDERMLTVMQQALPAEIVAFLTPDTDPYTTVLLGGGGSRRPARPIPAKAVASLLGENALHQAKVRIDVDDVSIGSNQWAVSRHKTRDGRAMVANDMHLGLGMPNIWYRAELRYDGAQLAGVTLPGLPLVVAGSNGKIAWGFTNVDADVIDLVRLEIDPRNPLAYRTPGAWAAMQTTEETITVKDGSAVSIELYDTIWGPVSPKRLLGNRVAVRWTALDRLGLNLGLLDLDRAYTLERAIEVLNRSGCPPQNVALADDRGRIAWTYTGFLPRRRGLDGSVSLSWADGGRGWDGFVPPDQMPKRVDPPQGFIATANNRTIGKDYPHVVGHNYANSYRAFRISQRLAEMETVTERDMLGLQLDTESAFFEFYRRLILDLVQGDQASGEAELAEASRNAAAWNGRFDADSRGIGLLTAYRKELTNAVLGPLMRRCERADPGFSYAWRELDTPLRALLTERIPKTLPDRRFADWDDFLRAVLKNTVARLKADYGVTDLAQLNWGRINTVQVKHPFSRAQPWLSRWLDMPESDSAGCSGHCVRVLSGDKGASERFVISPGHPDDAIFHMPGGQSGHFLSAHYRDQHPAWVDGRSLPFFAGPTRHSLVFTPPNSP